jgi:hypothetical protein
MADGGLTFPECLSCGPGARASHAESIGPLNFGFRIADFGFFGFSFSIRIPQSTFRNFSGPLVPWNLKCLMISACNALAPGPGTRGKAHFRWRPFQSALSGSLFFIPPALLEVMIAMGEEAGN